VTFVLAPSGAFSRCPYSHMSVHLSRSALKRKVIRLQQSAFSKKKPAKMRGKKRLVCPHTCFYLIENRAMINIALESIFRTIVFNVK